VHSDHVPHEQSVQDLVVGVYKLGTLVLVNRRHQFVLVVAGWGQDGTTHSLLKLKDLAFVIQVRVV